MDSLIAHFITTTYTVEYANTIYRSFKICEDFEYRDLYSGFIDILTVDDTTDNYQDRFTDTLTGILDGILQLHHLRLIPTATIRQRNELLTALYTIQDLEDYSSVLSVLESLETDTIKITTILADYCQLDMSEQLSIIDSFSPITLELLKSYISLRDTERTQGHNHELIPTLRVLYRLYGRDSIGHLLIEHGVCVGLSIPLYMQHIDSIVADDDAQTAINVASLIYMTPESLSSPLVVYTTNSLVMLKSLTVVSKIEPLVIAIIDRVQEFTKATTQVSS